MEWREVGLPYGPDPAYAEPMAYTDRSDSKLDDVARLAGVSRSTASRVLTGASGTSSTARAAVLAAAEKLDYQANPVARALAIGTGVVPVPREGRVVVAVVGAGREVLRDPYVATAVAAVAEVAEDFGAGVGLEWLALGGSPALRRLAEDPAVRGVILINTVEELLVDLPLRLIGRVVSIGVGSPDVPHFDVDNGGAAEASVKHLMLIGRREIAMLTGPPWLPCVRRQTQRYLDLMAAAGWEARTVPGDFSSAGGAAGMTEVLHRWPGTDAVFATCDAAAFGAVSVLANRGLRVPHDIAVAGFDDVPFAAQASPRLTTATHPVSRIAATAALAVLEPTVAGRLPHFFGSELVLRESA
jgi:DNA-binding LacI/PurR family transcriptional regulator